MAGASVALSASRTRDDGFILKVVGEPPDGIEVDAGTNAEIVGFDDELPVRPGGGRLDHPQPCAQRLVHYIFHGPASRADDPVDPLRDGRFERESSAHDASASK